MGEPLLAAYLQTLLYKLHRLLNFAPEEGFKSELRTWRLKLLPVRRVLCDAEEKQMSVREVKKWLDNLRDVAYNADDALEELRHEALQRQNNSSSDSAASSSSQVQDLLAQIQEITTSFSSIEQVKRDLGLEERPVVRSSIINNRLPTTSLVNSSQVVGRKENIDAILKLLDIGEATKAEENRDRMFGMAGFESSSINEHGKHERSSALKASFTENLVIPIVGMGGVGKTTLAKCIYNHNTVKNSFDFKAWVCASDNFDIIGMTKAILCQVANGDAIDVNDLNLLQEGLKEKISEKRFLIVLDDIWNEDHGEWENLFIPLKSGRRGSVVIVTTRSSKVASIAGCTSQHRLSLLKDDECLSILAQHALRAENFDAHPNLKGIGEKMVRRCNGLPLAAKTLGGLLRDQDQAKWEEVCKSSLYRGPISENRISEKIAPALWLSFNYLPSHLKQCFAYCSIFPKDYEFDEEEIILLWMAEGFLGEPNEEKQMEDLGHEYFHDLLSRSLLQQSRLSLRKFVIHDLIHDLVQIVAGRVCFRMEDKEAKDVDIEAVRHLSYPLNRPEPKFEVLKNTKRLRTLLALPTQEIYYSYVKNKLLLHDLLPQLRYLRVLSLSYCQMDELPSSVGDLKHIRYLNLSNTNFKLLPEFLCDFHYLQSLILNRCLRLQQLPLRLKDLANLRYLDISGAKELLELPPHVLDLKFFRKLTKFVVGERDDVLGLTGLEKKYRLPGGLEISISGKVEDVEDALAINLMNKKNIEKLKFGWRLDLDNTENAESQVQILNLLEPHKMLRNLEIKRYSGVTLPKWIGDSSYSKLVELSLIYCKRCKSLPSLGQLPLLQKLTIKGMSEIETIGAELYREASPSLTVLHIENRENLRTLPDGIGTCESLESFPSGVVPSTLAQLEILSCENLKCLPSNLPELTSLRDLCVAWCDNLVSLPERGLPPSLQDLEFGPCAKVEKQMWDAARKLCCLTSLALRGGFRDVVCFEFLLPPTLTSLLIDGFPNLKSLPSSAFQNLTSLARLEIWYCPNLQSLPVKALPPSLKLLDIVGCPKLKSKCEEGGQYWACLSHIPCLCIDY